ncbi:glutathione S-transferase N-terminal domain-containing protein [Sphingomonas bacterium]|uniref:glutathione S-transferase N-terminal domain-containing protein n=1 Tax=Sphingomonas bacterium TaxID=1895847 RepID=UPI001576511F|nr:glutathione S-transferase N-terminal domain-containing protein [Sphingomonas bacterium]
MKLYFAPGACSLADHIALNETETPHSLVKVDLKTKQTEDKRDYTAINPKGYVPTLELDDGGILTENIAILTYIADTSGRLMPEGGIERYRALEMLAYISTELHKNFKPFFNPAASQAEKDEGGKTLARRFAYIGQSLDRGRFVLGQTISAADCYLFVMLMWARKNGIDHPPALHSYFDRMRDRPAILKSLQEEGLS